MRKQVDFSLRVFEYNPTEPSKTSQANSAYIKTNYLDNDWEILSTEVTQVAANSVFIAISFIKYENVEQVRSKSIGEPETLDGKPKRASN